ncbi:MAG: hypothetical protein QF535_17195 [Anaerolineales bacterium]|nr:hypothetical protein [Anaerolineales bacterium]
MPYFFKAAGTLLETESKYVGWLLDADANLMGLDYITGVDGAKNVLASGAT